MSSYISSSELDSVAVANENGPRRFVAALLATIAIGLGMSWMMTAKLPDGYLPGDYETWHIKQQMVADCRLADTVFMGDSRASAGFVPRMIPGSVNVALGGSSPIEQYYMAERILACPKPPKRIVFSMSISNVALIFNFWSRSGLFGFLSFSDYEQVRQRSRALHDNTIYGAPTVGDLDAVLTEWLYAHRFPTFSSAYLLQETLIGRLRENRRIAEETSASVGQHSYGAAAGSADPSPFDIEVTKFKALPILDDYLRRMLALFAAKGIPVIFLAVPMNEATYAALSPETKLGFRDYIASLARQMPDFTIVGDPLPHWDNKWFGDTAHLNQAGANLFSSHVAGVLADLNGRAGQ